ncbi:MAG: TetR/AcrR family transcriptional regulator [Cyanobacteria bacterium P01_A01_bin.123]
MNIRSSDKKQRIFTATMELVAENGLHATPMSQISKRSQVSAGAIYHYFPSKDAIINELYLELKKEMMVAVFQGYDIQMPYQERFLLIWHNALDYFLAEPLQLSFTEQCAISPLISEAVCTEVNRLLAPLMGFVAEGIESGQLKRMEIPLLLALIQSSIVAVAKLQTAGSHAISDEQRQIVAQVCWDGLKGS